MDRTEAAYEQNGRTVSWAECTTDDLLVMALRYQTPEARLELEHRGVDWKAYT